MSDLINREDVLSVLCFSAETGKMLCEDLRNIFEEINKIPSAEPEWIIRCKDCMFYDPAHVEKDGRRYEYSDLPKEAFVDPFGNLANIVTSTYGVNVGGRCTADKRTIGEYSIFRSEDDYCSKAIRRGDDEDACRSD